ncbi:MAG: hypothetical protein V4677_02260 [Bacteroidota bacterium]
MARSLKLYLSLSSICLFLACCRISKFKHPSECNRVVINKDAFLPVLKETGATKFKGSIDVLKNHLTGLVIVKKTDSASTHIIFVTEIGMKMFDFEWKDQAMKAVYVFEPLNKPALINALLSNFKAILLLDVYTHAGWCSNKKIRSYYKLEGAKHRYIIADTLKGISSQQIFNKNKRSCFINYTFVPETKTYSQIRCTQFGLVKIRTELNRIEE